MLNLLFISNSPKVQQLKKALQPVLKVIIDVVPDFDHGLKDVFEKRPSTVCIHEQISGVTGESVARHIQMLLKSGSPRFILMHDGSSKAKSIKGLFEHVIDINQPCEDLLKHFQEALKSLLGEQWDEIYVPPTETASAPSFILLPHESQPEADKLVNNFIQDIETTSYSSSDSESDGFYSTVDIPVGDSVTLTTIDKITDMLLAQANQNLKEVNIPVAPTDFIISQDKVSAEEPIPEELLMAFEKNYRSKTTSMKRTLLALLLLILVSATGWFLVKQKPTVLTILSKMIFPTAPPAVKPSTIVPKARHIEQMSPQKQAPVPVVAQVLPAFIPLSGHESSYSVKRLADTDSVRELAVLDGMTTLKQDGLLKVFQGLTDIHEVRRVCIK